MKKWLILVSLAAVQNICFADATLEFSRYSNSGKQSTFNILVKNQQLRLDDHSQRFNLFDAQKKRFISQNQRNGKIAQMDMRILTQRADQLNQKRLNRLHKVLSELDKKRPQMSQTELEVSEELINQMKYPKQYGAYTLNQLQKKQIQKEIAGIPCQIYQLSRKKQRLRTLCIADQKQLGLSTQDFNTLLDYEEFQYQVESQINLAMGDADFDLISLQAENISGIVIESQKQLKNQQVILQRLKKISTQALDKEAFKLPKSEKIQLE